MVVRYLDFILVEKLEKQYFKYINMEMCTSQPGSPLYLKTKKNTDGHSKVWSDICDLLRSPKNFTQTYAAVDMGTTDSDCSIGLHRAAIL